MRSAIIILNLFAAAWAWAALGGLDAPSWTLALPVLVSVGIAVAGWRAARIASNPPPEVSRRIARVVGFWSVLEVLLIVIGAWAMFRWGGERLIAPLVGLIVGLHFVALARGLPFRAYYATGAALIAVSIVAFVLPGALPLIITGFGAALVLWSTSVWISVRSSEHEHEQPSEQSSALR